MDVQVKTLEDGVTLIEPHGDIDGSTAPLLQEKILAAAQPNSRLLLDMSGVDFMSSAGLRVMLLLYRQISGNNGRVILAGLNESIEDAMSATGFLKFFSTAKDRDAGLQQLRQ
jgi:anti-sigma B factor antagonist